MLCCIQVLEEGALTWKNKNTPLAVVSRGKLRKERNRAQVCVSLSLEPDAFLIDNYSGNWRL